MPGFGSTRRRALAGPPGEDVAIVVEQPSSVWWGSEQVPLAKRGGVVTIGNFDGVHLGHRALLAAARELAGDGDVVAYTFDPSPRDVMVPGHGVPRIQATDGRVDLLRRQGADQVVVEAFTPEFATQEPEAFARDVLQRRLGATGCVLGYDFRFGRGRRGDAELLRRVLDVPVRVVDPVYLGPAPISSTRVRAAVSEGRIREATACLGRPHVLNGLVVRGQEIGRMLGFPTANLALSTELRPPLGVYAVRVMHEGRSWRGVANHGVRPTVDASGSATFEVHVLDFTGDLYGQHLEVELVERLRAERAFRSRDELVEQIARDSEHAREALDA